MGNKRGAAVAAAAFAAGTALAIISGAHTGTRWPARPDPNGEPPPADGKEPRYAIYDADEDDPPLAVCDFREDAELIVSGLTQVAALQSEVERLTACVEFEMTVSCSNEQRLIDDIRDLRAEVASLTTERDILQGQLKDAYTTIGGLTKVNNADAACWRGIATDLAAALRMYESQVDAPDPLPTTGLAALAVFDEATAGES